MLLTLEDGGARDREADAFGAHCRGCDSRGEGASREAPRRAAEAIADPPSRDNAHAAPHRGWSGSLVRRPESTLISYFMGNYEF